MKNISTHKKRWWEKIHIPSSITIILSIVLLLIFLTWVIPHSSYAEAVGSDGKPIHVNNKGEYIDLKWYGDSVFGLNFLQNGWYVSENGRYGILDLPMLIFAGFLDSLGVIVFIIAVGIFIEVLMSTKTLEVGILSLENKLNGKEIVIIPILFCLFSFGGTIEGMQEGTVAYFPLIVPFLILAGFDSMTGFMIIVLGTTTGFGASTVNPFSIGAFVDGFPEYPDGTVVSIGTGLVIRLIIWILFTAVGATFVTIYAYRVRKNKNKSFLNSEHREEDIIWARNKLGVIENDHSHKLSKSQILGLWVLLFVFAIMIIGVLPWDDWNIETDGFISWFFFGSIDIGEWFYLQLTLLFLVGTLILSIVFRMNFKELKTVSILGAKSMVKVGIIVGLARTIAIVLIYSGLSDAMVKSLLNSVNGTDGTLFVILLFPIFLILSFFLPSTSGLAGASSPIIGPLVLEMSTSAEQYLALAAGVMLSFTLAEGIINMFSPTNAIIFAQAESSNLEYGIVLKPLLYYAGLMTILSFAAISISATITL